MTNHYKTLGVEPTATEAEIRSAYRKLVLVHHPDRSKNPKSAEMFVRVREAYEVLSQPEARRLHDLRLSQTAPAPEPPKHRPPKPKTASYRSWGDEPESAPNPRSSISEQEIERDLERLAALFSLGKMADAEVLARSLNQRLPTLATPYAVLGDIARIQGKHEVAARQYAYAVQYSPGNRLFEQRYDEMLRILTPQKESRRINPWAAQSFAWGIVLCCLAYVAVSREKPMLPSLELVNTWTLGLVVMLFISGAVVGSALSIGGLLERFMSTTTSAMGGVTPAFYLGIMAIVNYWAAAALYIATSLLNGSSSVAVSRVVASVGGITFLATLTAGISTHVDAFQVLVWGGNVAYIGAVVGWMIADSMLESVSP